MKKRCKLFIYSVVLLIAIIAFAGYRLTRRVMLFPSEIISSQFNGDHNEKWISENGLSGLVVYTFPVQDIPQLFLKNLSTGETKQLTNSGDNSDAKFSPDGKQILYLLKTKENADDIYIMNADGSNKQALIATGADEDFVSWAPDGTKIAFSSDESGSTQIYIMDVNSNEVTKISHSATYASVPSWSSDGTKIAFQSADGNEAGRTQIYVMNADGSNLIQMTDYHINTWDGGPVWCPDDSCLIFLRDTGTRKIMILDMANKSIAPLFPSTFGSKDMLLLKQSSSMRYITFVVDGEGFAFDIIDKELYSLDIPYVLSLSLYP